MVVELVDVAAAEGEHKVAGLPVGAQVRFGIVKGGGVNGVDAVGAHALHHHLGLDIAGILFARGVDIGHKGDIRRLGAGEVIVKQALDAAVGVGLHDGPHAVVRLHDRNAHGVAHLGGVVAVVVVELYAVDDAGQFKATVRALEIAHGAAHFRHVRTQMMRAAQRGQRIVHLERAGHLQLHMADHFAVEGKVEHGMAAFVKGQVLRHVVALVFQTKGEGLAGELAQLFHDALVIAVADGRAVLRQQAEEAAEGFLNVVDIAVEIQMIRVDVEHHGHRGTHVQEAGVELACFGQEGAALADARTAADEIQIAADVDGGVHLTLHENLGKHGGGGGFAVRAAHADGRFEAFHQLAQQRCTLDIGQAKPLNFHALGVVRQDGHGIHHQIRAVDVLRLVADGDRDAQIIAQVASGIGFQIIRTGNDVALLLQHLRQAAHAAAADADHVDVLALIITNMGYGHVFHPFPVGRGQIICRFNQ